MDTDFVSVTLSSHDSPSRRPRRRWQPTLMKGTYHHGDLRAYAIRRGRELVAERGVDALTLRGLARELGVTAPALVHHFGSRRELRAAVADEILNEACAWARDVAKRDPRRLADAWLAFAASNGHTYRFVSGEGWRPQLARPNGLYRGVASPRRALEDELVRATRRFGTPRGRPELARALAVSTHGLALAVLDGVPISPAQPPG